MRARCNLTRDPLSVFTFRQQHFLLELENKILVFLCWCRIALFPLSIHVDWSPTYERVNPSLEKDIPFTEGVGGGEGGVQSTTPVAQYIHILRAKFLSVKD